MAQIFFVSDMRKLLTEYRDGQECEFFIGNVGTREVDVAYGEATLAINVALPTGYLLIAEWEWKQLQEKLAAKEERDAFSNN